jgi:hypothetical protein
MLSNSAMEALFGRGRLPKVAKLLSEVTAAETVA